MYRNIELRGYKRNSKKLYGFDSCYLADEEIAKNKFYLRNETRIDTHNDTLIKLYRFITREPMSYEEILSYDLHCPVCGGELRVHGLPFARAENKGFTIGTGVNEPTGILDDTKGAIKSHETSSITYDDITKLFFSLDKQHRKNCKFMMNNETEFAIRKLKDNDGAYIWNHNTDTILGKEVLINEFMSDDKPIICGDFSYYYIVINRPLSLRTLKEKFILTNQIGYVVIEYIDGVLTNRNAIKYIEKV